MIHGACRLTLLLLLLAAAAPGCAGYPWQKTTLYVNSGIALYREKKVVEGNQVSLGYQHPIDIPLEKTVLVLSQLVYYHDPLIGKPQTLHVFTDQEIRGLAEPMTLALQAITPDERLRFLIVRSAWTDVIGGTRGTSGVVFRTPDGLLHLAFDKIHEQYQVAEGGEPDDVPIATEPTTLTKASPIVPATGMRLHLEAGGKKYPRWIEIASLDEVKPPAPPPAELAKPAGEPPRAIVIPTRPQVTSPDSPKPPPTPPPTPPPAADEEKYLRLRAKLEQLKRLRQDGVLSDEEYQREYQKLIAEL
jgi:hypothetical protein